MCIYWWGWGWGWGGVGGQIDIGFDLQEPFHECLDGVRKSLSPSCQTRLATHPHTGPVPVKQQENSTVHKSPLLTHLKGEGWG